MHDMTSIKLARIKLLLQVDETPTAGFLLGGFFLEPGLGDEFEDDDSDTSIKLYKRHTFLGRDMVDGFNGVSFTEGMVIVVVFVL